MQTKRNKKGMVEASEEQQKHFDSYPDTKRLTLKEILERSRQQEKPKELVN
ncbi:hypothetical protein M0L20_28495 [Spirosoma sp. RP8]|uniref:CopG family transcriptional regulator n=1 Tax=Spirosoma liriopis TaxID=2937440 RepID=A0ABT0HUH3_9BACT|nr:hypothetical protein [Spirosoma liriopis]MCK8495839.1 hypothetical protein [Spirosoma liriopis]